MEIIFGASHLPCLSSNNLTDIKKFLHTIIDEGFLKFDTAESYCHGNSEITIGSLVRSDLNITTKVGGNYQMLSNGMRFPISAITRERFGKLEVRLMQKLYLLRNGLLPQFNPNIYPNMIKKRLEISLKRLRRDNVDNYLLHGLPQHANLEYFVEELVSLKTAGYVKKIGISYPGNELIDLEWADMVQIPFHRIHLFKPHVKKISAYGVFMNHKNEDTDNLEFSINESGVQSLVVRSSNLSHLQKLAKL
jgi:aryl-alcohol dehydrogenase-like predicted oxidoreductase